MSGDPFKCVTYSIASLKAGVILATLPKPTTAHVLPSAINAPSVPFPTAFQKSLK